MQVRYHKDGLWEFIHLSMYISYVEHICKLQNKTKVHQDKL